MLKFIQDIPRVVSRLVDRIDSPSVQDTILRIITCEEAGVAGVVEVNCDNNVVARVTGTDHCVWL